MEEKLHEEKQFQNNFKVTHYFEYKIFQMLFIVFENKGRILHIISVGQSSDDESPSSKCEIM